ncbi:MULTISPECIES: hypothetical protein [unclassified Oceanispirochaeta]|uniref:hypothetical protein n=1 Tax=unclassified Oceanispirochaeta TaxID=2635722 RepID=UPI000E0907DF|nr:MULTISPECIES: hypothetical protein [unclassified Oceanispirochaeta]MBF9015202.1 hypothetical protein [Oceanispirochaeta sp. M2]NPD71660.1 hypothetical protein [Oceanispirochaeta sp. M1]RDG32857.1 hypothetical protein DV872_06060 [Oceanispirochaeta sp. M1]
MKKALLLIALLGSLNSLYADNTGILKSRLIELAEGDYLLEVEVPILQESAIGDPVFPDRFILSEKGRSEFQGMVTLHYRYNSLTDALNEKDLLILPWIINGTSLTVFRQDGDLKQRLYLRTLEGIKIPLGSYFHKVRTKGEIVTAWIRQLLSRAELLIPFILLALILASFESLRSALNFCLIFFAGQSLAMVTGELGLPGPDLLYAQLLVLALALFIASFRDIPDLRVLFAPAGVVGYLFGAGLFNEISFLPYSPDILLILHLLSTVYWNLLFTLFTMFLILASSILIEKGLLSSVLKYLCGVFALFFFLLLFQERVVTGERDVLNLSAGTNQSRYDLPDPQVLQNNQNTKSMLSMTVPAQAYMAIDPFELRIEVLLRLDELMSTLHMDDNSLALEDQKDFLITLIDEFVSSIRVSADDVSLHPIDKRADFVTLGSGGVSLRSTAVIEKRNEGLVGLSLIYGTAELLREVQVEWNFFPSGIDSLPGRTSQIWGTEAVMISREDNIWAWANPVKRSLFPEIQEISVKSAGIPFLSILFLIGAAVVVIRKAFSQRLALSLLLLTSILTYPFARIPIPGGWSPRTEEQIAAVTEALLTNLYRSFDVQEDREVYDRLALSVSGELLQDVFLQNRKAMVLENKGGARARMDHLELLSMDNLRKEKDGFRADAEWTVSGSVSHFGHTHYRKNRYLADILLTVEEKSWKITNLKMLREEREF